MTVGAAGAERTDVVRTADILRPRIFRSIYVTNRWNGTETRSGPGSTFASTRPVRERLPGLVAELGVKSVLDAACGASAWMPDLPGYIGVDIVPEAVAHMRRIHPDRYYETLDICIEDLPRSDLVIARDVFAHLSLKDVRMAIANIQNSGAKWLFATTFVGADNTIDCRTGSYHELDLSQPPFTLGTPVETIADGFWEDEVIYPTKRMGLWELER